MTVEELIELVLDLQDAGEMHGMDIDQAVDFFADVEDDVTTEMKAEATERLYNGNY